MREACIILPANDPLHAEYGEGKGWPTAAQLDASNKQKRARSDFVRAIVSTFGGCTITEGFGYWADDGAVVAETVKVYTFAVDERLLEAERIIDYAATTVALALDQKAVYVRYPNGDVSIIDLCNKEKQT